MVGATSSKRLLSKSYAKAVGGRYCRGSKRLREPRLQKLFQLRGRLKLRDGVKLVENGWERMAQTPGAKVLRGSWSRPLHLYSSPSQRNSRSAAGRKCKR